MDKVTGKDVNNWLRGITPGNSKDYGATNKTQALTEILLLMDVSDARTVLTNKDYKHDLIKCAIGKDGKQRWVLVFANQEQLKDLQKLGHAFQFDGDASLNKLWGSYDVYNHGAKSVRNLDSRGSHACQ